VLIDAAFAGVNRHDCNQRGRGPTPAHSDVPTGSQPHHVLGQCARRGPARGRCGVHAGARAHARLESGQAMAQLVLAMKAR